MKKILISLFILLFLLGCGNSKAEIEENNLINTELTIKVGHYGIIKGSTFKEATRSLGYTGMSNDKVFSITNNIYRYTVNLYYPTNTKELIHNSTRLQILDIKPEYIKIKILGYTD